MTLNELSLDEPIRANTCFVISAYDERGDYFFNTYVKEACEQTGFTPERADRQLSHDIADGIETSLGIAPVVVAYLASPPWNSNVILELGYRLATRAPLVIVCDEPPPGEKLVLPFNISTMRVVEIPPREKLDEAKRRTTIDRIIKLIDETVKQSEPIGSNQAVATIHAPVGPLDAKEAVYAAATPLATKLFGVDGQLVGRTLAQFIVDRQRDMPEYQYQAFMWEQARLSLQASPDKPAVIASTPIVFSTGQYKARAYLPIIVNYVEVGTIQQITVLYLDVTSIVQHIRHHVLKNTDYYISNLDPAAPPIEDFVESVTNEAEPEIADGVFLAHNSKDKEWVRPIYELLRKHGGQPWFDEAAISPGANWLKEIENGLQKCRAAFIFVGKNGYGEFQDDIEAKQLFISMLERDDMPLVPILLDDLEKPPGLLRAYQAVRHDVANTEDWIRKFVTEHLPRRSGVEAESKHGVAPLPQGCNQSGHRDGNLTGEQSLETLASQPA